VTIGHPTGPVTPKNYTELSHGFVSGGSRTKVDGEAEEYVAANAAVQSEVAIKKVDAKDLEEISVGYFCDTIYEPGVTPSGERYDAIQRNIRVNHVALLPSGGARAGRQARLALDGNQELEGKSMSKIKFDGVEFDPSSEADMAALQRRIDEKEKLKADESERIQKLESSNGELQAKLDAAEKRADAAEKSITSKINEELKFRDRMRALLPNDYTFDGKTPIEVKLDAIKNVAPDASILKDEKPIEAIVDGYLRGVFDRKPTQTQDSNFVSDLDKINADYAAKLGGFDPKVGA
jgi:hypothetical protein